MHQGFTLVLFSRRQTQKCCERKQRQKTHTLIFELAHFSSTNRHQLLILTFHRSASMQSLLHGKFVYPSDFRTFHTSIIWHTMHMEGVVMGRNVMKGNVVVQREMIQV